MKLKYVLTEVDQRLNGKSLPLMSVSKIQGVVPRSDLMGDSGRAESIDHYKRCLPGDLVVNRMAAYQGAVGIAPIEGAVSPDYSVIRGPHELVHFLFYFLKSDLGLGLVTSLLKGIGSTDSGAVRTPRLNWRDMAEISMEFAPDHELVEAVNYLDQETFQIDLLISKKEQLIEKLLERRQALITQVVTKGLDPNVSLKNSGVEWIGNSPIEWSVRRLSTIANLQTGATPEGAFFSDAEGFPWLRPDDLDKVRGVVQATRFIPADTAKGMVTAPAGSSLMSGIGNVGDVAFLRAEASHNQQLTSVKARGENDRYLYFSLVAAKQEIQRLAVGNVVQILNNARLGSLQVPVPPVAIQKEIAEFLDSSCERIDTLIERSRVAVGCLQERRQALITQVVTGKLDVRGFASGNS